MSYGPLNSATHIFTRLKRLLTISDLRWIAGSQGLLSKPNQEPPFCDIYADRALTSYLSLNFIITNNHTELQSPRDVNFVCCASLASLLFTELSRVTPKAEGFSGVLCHMLFGNIRNPYHTHSLKLCLCMQYGICFSINISLLTYKDLPFISFQRSLMLSVFSVTFSSVSMPFFVWHCKWTVKFAQVICHISGHDQSH